MATIATYTRSADRNLTTEGYKFFPASVRPELVLVAKPSGGAYIVDTINGTCNCIAGKRGVKCCHLREAKDQAAQQIAQAEAVMVAGDATEAVHGAAERKVTINTLAGFGSREAFDKARSLDFD